MKKLGDVGRDRSHGAQKTVVKKLYFIPSRVGNLWRILSRGEASDL